MREEDLQSILGRVVEEVERLTRLLSRWNGELVIIEEIDMFGQPSMHGKKEWACAISIHAEIVNDPAVFTTLVHEAVHSVSVGVTQSLFHTFPGYEEGTVEWLTRAYSPAVARALGHDQELPVRMVFKRYLDALGSLQARCALSPIEFYESMLRTPLARREASVVELIRDARPELSLRRVLAEVSRYLRELRGA